MGWVLPLDKIFPEMGIGAWSGIGLWGGKTQGPSTSFRMTVGWGALLIRQP